MNDLYGFLAGYKSVFFMVGHMSSLHIVTKPSWFCSALGSQISWNSLKSIFTSSRDTYRSICSSNSFLFLSLNTYIFFSGCKTCRIRCWGNWKTIQKWWVPFSLHLPTLLPSTTIPEQYQALQRVQDCSSQYLRQNHTEAGQIKTTTKSCNNSNYIWKPWHQMWYFAPKEMMQIPPMLNFSQYGENISVYIVNIE